MVFEGYKILLCTFVFKNLINLSYQAPINTHIEFEASSRNIFFFSFLKVLVEAPKSKGGITY